MENSTFIPCGPCAFKSIKNEAISWCPSCGEGLCDDCLHHHKASAASRKHTVISNDLHKVPSILFSIRQTCREHELTFDLYCDSHDVPLCSKCVSEHKRCMKILPMCYVSRNSKFSTKLWDVEHGIAHILGNIDDIIRAKETNIQSLKEEKSKVESEMRHLREKINLFLDDLESRVLNDIAVIYTKFSIDAKSFLSKIDARKRSIESIAQNISFIREFASDLQTFLLTKKLESEFYKEQEEFISELGDNELEEVDLDVSFNSNIASIFASVQSMAEVNVIRHKSVISQLKKEIRDDFSPANALSGVRLLCRMPVMTPREPKTKFIRNCVVLENEEFIFTDDSENKRLVWFNADGSHKRNIEMRSEPYDLTIYDRDKIAVTVPREKSIFMFDLSKVKFAGKVLTRNYCYGLTYHDTTFLVSVLNNGIQTIDFKGQVLRTLPMNVEKVCNIHIDVKKIYFTEYDSSTVSCYDIHGKCLWKFRHKLFSGPLGLSTDNDGNVFVLGYDSDNLIVISPDGKQCVFLLEGKDKLFGPTGIFFHKQSKQLLVCNRFDGQAYLYDLVS